MTNCAQEGASNHHVGLLLKNLGEAWRSLTLAGFVVRQALRKQDEKLRSDLTTGSSYRESDSIIRSSRRPHNATSRRSSGKGRSGRWLGF